MACELFNSYLESPAAEKLAVSFAYGPVSYPHGQHTHPEGPAVEIARHLLFEYSVEALRGGCTALFAFLQNYQLGIPPRTEMTKPFWVQQVSQESYEQRNVHSEFSHIRKDSQPIEETHC